MISRLPSLAAGFVLAAAMAAAGPAAGLPAYFSHPDIHGETIVLCAESDLWAVPLSGGEPRRLTTHPGDESFPAFSPDGRWIAFSGHYDGNLDVYVIPAAGGEPRRLTWHPGGDEVVGWTPGGEAILFRSGRAAPFGAELYAVALDGGDPRRLPVGYAYRLDIDPDSGLWAFNRSSRERATWKRYRGGSASDIWVGDPKKADFRRVTNFQGEDVAPMWHGGRIWFLSDQGGTANIWSIRPDGSDRKRHTDFGEWDARWASMGPDGRIVVTVAADVHVFDPASGLARKVEIGMPSDRQLTRLRYPEPGRYLTGFDLSPDGERLAVVVRGEIFSVPVKDGVTLPVTRGTGARERDACYDHKGERILYITDEPREDEFRLIDAWGRGEPAVVKKAGDGGWHLRPVPSPDGRWIAWGDNEYRLLVMPLDGGKPVEVDRGANTSIRDYAWSPDGRWLAYARPERTDFSNIHLYDTRERKSHRLTGPYTNDYSVAWDPDGRYLYFASDRSTNPVIGETDFVNIEFKNDKLYLVLLRKDVKNPFARLSGLPPGPGDEAAGEDKGKDQGKAGKKDGKAKDKGEKAETGAKGGDEPPPPVEIDLDGLAGRVVELPVGRGRYGGLGATATHLFYLSAPFKGMAEQPGIFEEGEPDLTLRFFELKEKKDETFLEGVSGYALCKAGKIAVMKKPGELYVVGTAAAPGPKLAEDKIDLSRVVVELDPRQEWEQIYHESWRQLREYYWDAEMSGVDWRAIRDQYAALLPRLASRGDLTDLLGQVFGEMNTSHTYIFGGDSGIRVERRQVGLLGAQLAREGDGYKVERIYRGDAADCVRSPLAEPGVDVREGEYVVAINRRPLQPDRPLLAHLASLAGKEILISVNSRPRLEGAREVVVVPLASEGELIYSDWVRRNREYVAEKTGDRIGYLHVPDMMTEGLVEFNRWFYPQLDKEGMVVDMRWNGGGFASQMMVQILARKVQSFSLARGGGVSTYPDRCLNGPFVVLTNEFAGSDGDIFPHACQLGDLAPVIGVRSWGGVVGIRSLRPLVDGGLITNPEVAWWDPRDRWGLENRGVVPDIEVFNLPQDLARGRDAQLDRGIDEVLRLHREHPPLKPDFGKDRQRTRDSFRGELED